MGLGNVRHLDPGDSESHRTEQAHVIEWPGYGGRTTVEWLFAPQQDAQRSSVSRKPASLATATNS